VAELALAARLADEAAGAVRRLADRLAVSHLRLAHVGVDPELTREAVDDDLQVELIVDRLTREFRVDANVGKPQVAYREAIRKPAHGTGRFVRQTGGKGQFGH